MLKVILVDDHPIFRSGLAFILNTFSDNVSIIGEYGNGAEFLDGIASNGVLPDLVIMDVQMPVMDAYGVLEEMKKRSIHTPVLIISMVQDEKGIVRMMTKGIRGFLPKDSDPELFVEAIHKITAGGVYFADSISGILEDAFPVAAPKEEPAFNSYTGTVPLSDKEQEFIRLACSEYTYKEIAEILNLSVKTIDGYRGVLFEKLNVKSRPGLVLFAVKNRIIEVD
ncbi:MAG: response regulator [Flavobacteriales bacterium]